MKYLKFSFCLTATMLLNGSFTPIGQGKPRSHVNYQVRPDKQPKSVEDEVAEKVAIIEDMSKHEEEVELSLVFSQIQHNRKVDSLTDLIKNIKP